MQWAVGLYLATIAYGIARSMRFVTSKEEFPWTEFYCVKAIQLALIPLFGYGLYRWIKGIAHDIDRSRK